MGGVRKKSRGSIFARPLNRCRRDGGAKQSKAKMFLSSREPSLLSAAESEKLPPPPPLLNGRQRVFVTPLFSQQRSNRAFAQTEGIYEFSCSQSVDLPGRPPNRIGSGRRCNLLRQPQRHRRRWQMSTARRGGTLLLYLHIVFRRRLPPCRAGWSVPLFHPFALFLFAPNLFVGYLL